MIAHDKVLTMVDLKERAREIMFLHTSSSDHNSEPEFINAVFEWLEENDDYNPETRLWTIDIDRMLRELWKDHKQVTDNS